MQSNSLAVEADKNFTVAEAQSAAPAAAKGVDAALGGLIKRGADVVLALGGLLLLSPLLILLALAVKLSSPGPVLYGHTRIGLGGRPFRCWKFRSMVRDADRVLERHLAACPEAKAEWDRTFKLKRDPRVTPLGRILREYSLDELPQLWNVLVGDMSIVGPRPVVREELRRYGQDQVAYLCARPGITGLWQVSGRSDVSYEDRIELDRAYVEKWSIRKDFAIILRTIPAAISAKGSY